MSASRRGTYEALKKEYQHPGVKVHQCATLVITMECWSKNSLKGLSKKPLHRKEYIERSSVYRSRIIDTRFGNDLLQSLTVEGDLH